MKDQPTPTLAEVLKDPDWKELPRIYIGTRQFLNVVKKIIITVKAPE